ncbi:hypothetical protein COV06_02195 [Candidatus Uhrbacteria bacterium CG10_big_fil_rev_8_21_14_0_10_50_16]|uniref:Rhodanese domain-containing protein n=1 Tax=Candidatus Uhrbacteria bacterium CG10_big_fil_rev_8_21_14_0_10_50_16 TaxID=1975039 RepID=A0A2H0RM97_9BACT|nr:MAG: hypothetical protein COV06_02195 [Candidatus Uhrbacteria bacterium CG10_big_fil_rev_8_21_14_0_10_50_16]
MKRSATRCLSWIGLALVLVSPQVVYALPPPDFIFGFGSQFMQLFSFVVLVVGVMASAMLRGSTHLYYVLRRHKIQFALGVLVVILISLLAAFVMNRMLFYRAQDKYTQEVRQSLEDRIDANDVVPAAPTPQITYLEAHPDMPLVLSNESFAAVDLNQVFVLDAREDEEYEIGRFPKSTHVRFADLLAGAWTELPTDKEIVVLCWSGIRGEEVTSFLRTKGLATRYLKEGADGWVRFGGLWDGEIAFSHVYSQERYSRTYTTSDVRALVATGALLVDAREEESFVRSGIAGSIHITSIFTPTAAMDSLLDRVPPRSTVITVCDDFVSCFDAKIVGIKLEQRGHLFLGRYAAPYEY